MTNLPPGKYQVPAPEYVIRGNRVKCTYCGNQHKTAAKYITHFVQRHMNADGTWRPAKKEFELPSTPLDYEDL